MLPSSCGIHEQSTQYCDFFHQEAVAMCKQFGRFITLARFCHHNMSDDLAGHLSHPGPEHTVRAKPSLRISNALNRIAILRMDAHQHVS